MSAIKNANDIHSLKKRKKTLDLEASDYEFGFETVMPKKSLLSNRKVLLVPANSRRNKIKKINNKLQSKLVRITQQPIKDENKTKRIKLALLSKQTVEKETDLYLDQFKVPDTNSFGAHVLSECVDDDNINTDTDRTIEIAELNPDEFDDNTLIQASHIEEDGELECSGKSKEPLLFRYNYFKILEKNSDSFRAMCVPCGLDENNLSVTVISAKENVSSNFITHLKVKFDNKCFVKIIIYHIYILCLCSVNTVCNMKGI